MNPLQKHPHLFANGKFKVRFDANVDYEIREGSTWKLNTDKLQVIESQITSPCTLIARPIDDMTDEEYRELPLDEDSRWYYERYIQDKLSRTGEIAWLKRKLSEGKGMTKYDLYLLSIGVYPFDQSHFEDGTVINSREI